MDPITLLIEGIIVGFLASIPLGPIGIICVQRTLSGTQLSGFVSGLGAATADTIFASLAIFSVSLMTSVMDTHKYWFTAVGGILIILLGFTIFYKRISRPGVTKRSRSGLLSDYFSVLFLTLTNPAYILIFITLFAALGIDSDGANASVSNLTLVLGVLLGASTWWLTLTFIISKLRKKFKLRHIWWISKITGGIIIMFGILIILSMVVDLGPVSKILP